MPSSTAIATIPTNESWSALGDLQHETERGPSMNVTAETCRNQWMKQAWSDYTHLAATLAAQRNCRCWFAASTREGDTRTGSPTTDCIDGGLKSKRVQRNPCSAAASS